MITPKAFMDGVGITNAAVTYYTVPAGTRAVIKKATFCNSNATPVTITISIGGTAGAAYAKQITQAKSLGAGETWSCHDLENTIMEAATIISILASVTTVVSGRISGYEVVT